MTSPNTQMADQFHADGFAIVRGLLDESALAELDAHLSRFIEQVLPEVVPGHKFFESDNGPLKHCSRMEQYDDYFAQLLRRPRIMEHVSACVGDRVEPITSEVFFKPARVGSAALAHQDNAYFNFRPPHGVVVSLALDDVTIDNGAVHFARGSHRLGDLPHDETGISLFGKALAQPLDPARYPDVPALLARGDATIHHFLTAHRSGPNRTDRRRRGLVLDYRACSAERDEHAHQRQEAYKRRVNAGR